VAGVLRALAPSQNWKACHARVWASCSKDCVFVVPSLAQFFCFVSRLVIYFRERGTRKRGWRDNYLSLMVCCCCAPAFCLRREDSSRWGLGEVASRWIDRVSSILSHLAGCELQRSARCELAAGCAICNELGVRGVLLCGIEILV
jgi:hypothetical protein